jgi:acyl carrier protein
MNTIFPMEQDTLTIKQKITEYVLKQTFAEKQKIKEETLLFKEGFFDSMGFIMLITFIEEEFAISVGDADLVEENFESVNAIASYILRKKSGQ